MGIDWVGRVWAGLAGVGRSGVGGRQSGWAAGLGSWVGSAAGRGSAGLGCLEQAVEEGRGAAHHAVAARPLARHRAPLLPPAHLHLHPAPAPAPRTPASVAGGVARPPPLASARAQGRPDLPCSQPCTSWALSPGSTRLHPAWRQAQHGVKQSPGQALELALKKRACLLQSARAAMKPAPAVDAEDAHAGSHGGATPLHGPPALHRSHHHVAARSSSAQLDSDVARLVILGQGIT